MNGWSDERLNAAYRAMADRPAPHELTAATVEAVGRAAAERPRRLATLAPIFGRPVPRLVGAVASVAIVAVVAAGLVLRATSPNPTSGPAASGAPTAVDGLPVQTVSQALAAEKSGAIVGDSLVAIKGWYAPMFLLTGCQPATPPPALVDTCLTQAREVYITEQEEQLVHDAGGISDTVEPSGPYIHALEPDGSNVGSLLLPGETGKPESFRPIPVVVVGHIHDVRAVDCPADHKAACDSAFVIDRVAWLNGKTFGPNVWIGADSTGQTLKPRLDANGVGAALRSSLDPEDAIVSMAGVGLVELYALQPGRGVSGAAWEGNPNIQWYVRVAGPQPRWPEMAFAGGSSGWFVVDDASGTVRAVGGWGFVPAQDPSYVPSVRTLPSGDLALPTINELAFGECAGVGVDAVLQGSATDPRVAWLEYSTGSTTKQRRDVIWPAGYRARFTPGLEILDENGTVVLSAGSYITGLCVYGDADLMQSPFR